MNNEIITLWDCLFLSEFKNKEIVINDGKIIEIKERGTGNGK